VRELHSLKVRPLIGTESNYPWLLFWSPDSRYIAFNAGGKIKKINVAGGPPLTICSTSGQAMGGSWNSQDDIIFGSFGRGIMRVPASGGTPSQLTMLNSARQEINHLAPLFLPDGKHFLYTCRSAISENSGAYIGSLDSKPEEQGSKQVAATSYWPVVYIPSQGSDIGKLLYLHEQALVAQPFNEKRLESTGETAPVVEQVGLSGSNAIFAAAINGTLAFQGRGALQSSQIRWFDRQGRALSTAAEASGVYGLSLSPKQDRVAFGWQSSAQSNLDIHLFDILRGKITRFTFGSEVSSRPVWSPDASLIGFTSNRDGGIYNIYQKLASGAKQEELLLKGSEHYVPTSWSSDGRLLLCFQADPKSKRDLCVLPLQGDRKPVYLLKTNFNEFDGRFSPDMRWIAYVSDESGGNEIYVRGFAQAAGGGSFELSGEWQVSREGGTGPRWRGDGKELYYRAPDGTVMAVEVFAKTEFNAGTPRSLFQAPPDIIQLTSLFADLPSWDVTAFGDRFILSTAAVGGAPSPFTVILNWTSLLKK
jgi:Tol biopolymer transport system component